jgi:hypothetical protein
LETKEGALLTKKNGKNKIGDTRKILLALKRFIDNDFIKKLVIENISCSRGQHI